MPLEGDRQATEFVEKISAEVDREGVLAISMRQTLDAPTVIWV